MITASEARLIKKHDLDYHRILSEIEHEIKIAANEGLKSIDYESWLVEEKKENKDLWYKVEDKLRELGYKTRFYNSGCHLQVIW